MSELDYTRVADWFDTCPLTYLPGLLIRVVTACVKRKIFVEGRIPHVVNTAIAEAKKEVEREG